MVEGINGNLDKGKDLKDALISSGIRRFRPIILTTLTTSAGLFPMILERSMQAQFLIPMAVSLVFGVIFATGLTLIIIPCLYNILNDFRRIFYWHLTGVWSSREFVEPRFK
jgi:multidrug efflux pump subunit AcrB